MYLLFFNEIVTELGPNMPTSPSYYMFVILFAVAAMMLNSATCRTRTVYSNTWVVQVDGGLTGAERIAAERGLTLLGQVREQSLMIYRVVILLRYFIRGFEYRKGIQLIDRSMRFGRFCLRTKRETFMFYLGR